MAKWCIDVFLPSYTLNIVIPITTDRNSMLLCIISLSLSIDLRGWWYEHGAPFYSGEHLMYIVQMVNYAICIDTKHVHWFFMICFCLMYSNCFLFTHFFRVFGFFLSWNWAFIIFNILLTTESCSFENSWLFLERSSCKHESAQLCGNFSFCSNELFFWLC